MTKRLAIKDFAYRPGPRYEHQGPHSAEVYRKTILIPAVRDAIENNEKVIVDLDKTGGIGRSFLEEISGGLIREDRIPYDVVLKHVVFVAEELQLYKYRVNRYLRAAHDKEGI